MSLALNQIPTVLCLDFDGVGHKSTDIADFKEAGLPLLAYIQTRPQLLRWLPLLAAALEGSEISIVVHSSWRNHVRDSDLRALLEPSGLADRFIGSAPQNMKREAAILSVLRTMGLDDEEIVILDDATDEFSRLLPQLIVCNPLLGLTDQAIIEQLRERLGLTATV